MTQPSNNQSEDSNTLIQMTRLIVEVRHLSERFDRFITDSERARREDRETAERARVEDRAVLQASIEALSKSNTDHETRLRATELTQREHATRLTIFSVLAAAFSVLASAVGAAIAYALSAASHTP